MVPRKRKYLETWPRPLERLEHAADVLRQWHKSMPLSWLVVLLKVAKYQHVRTMELGDGISGRELADRVDIPVQTVGDIILQLGPPCHRYEKAFNLIQQVPDPFDGRRHKLFLTDAGHKLVAKLAGILETTEEE